MELMNKNMIEVATSPFMVMKQEWLRRDQAIQTGLIALPTRFATPILRVLGSEDNKLGTIGAVVRIETAYDLAYARRGIEGLTFNPDDLTYCELKGVDLPDGTQVKYLPLSLAEQEFVKKGYTNPESYLEQLAAFYKHLFKSSSPNSIIDHLRNTLAGTPSYFW